MPGLQTKAQQKRLNFVDRDKAKRRGREGGRGRGNASVKNLLIINYQQHIRLGLTIKRVEGVRLGQDHR